MVYDLLILGGGPAGYRAAERAGESGLQTVLFEERALGGVCLNEGCIPTKALLYSAKLYDGAAHGEKYGVHADGLRLDHAEVCARRDKVVRTLTAGVKAAVKKAGAEVVAARAVVTGKSADGFTILAGGTVYTGKNLLVAAGSEPVVPPIPGIAEGRESGFVVTSREILALPAVPKRLAVIGGGVIGLEIASYFCSAGAEVTVIEMLGRIAGANDRDLTAILQKNLEKQGIRFLLSARVTGVTAGAVQYEKDGESGEIAADCVLLSIGRRASAAGLGLESIDVRMERGAVVTDEHLRTNIPGVYAAGDINGKSLLAHTASREAEVAVSHMCGGMEEMRYDAIPSVLYTHPELASVGETEESAAEKGIAVQTVRLPMRFSGRYLAENEGGDGQMKLLLQPGTHRILGAQALGSYASEFVAVIALCITMNLTAEALRATVFPHPTVGEVLREAAFAAETLD